MQTVSDTYTKIYNNPLHKTETILKVNGVTYYENAIVSLKTSSGVLKDGLEAGNCIARRIKATLLKTDLEIPVRAKLEPFVRVTYGKEHSEWIPKGKYYIDTRKEENSGNGDVLKIEGFCDMLKSEVDCPTDGLSWPAKDINVVKLIAQEMAVWLDPRTERIINNGYTIEIPTGYSCREVLSAIGAMYGGSWIMSDSGKLMLVCMDGLPVQTNYLITESGSAITFGGVRILV